MKCDMCGVEVRSFKLSENTVGGLICPKCGVIQKKRATKAQIIALARVDRADKAADDVNEAQAILDQLGELAGRVVRDGFSGIYDAERQAKAFAYIVATVCESLVEDLGTVELHISALA